MSDVIAPRGKLVSPREGTYRTVRAPFSLSVSHTLDANYYTAAAPLGGSDVLGDKWTVGMEMGFGVLGKSCVPGFSVCLKKIFISLK